MRFLGIYKMLKDIKHSALISSATTSREDLLSNFLIRDIETSYFYRQCGASHSQRKPDQYDPHAEKEALRSLV